MAARPCLATCGSRSRHSWRRRVAAAPVAQPVAAPARVWPYSLSDLALPRSCPLVDVGLGEERPTGVDEAAATLGRDGFCVCRGGMAGRARAWLSRFGSVHVRSIYARMSVLSDAVAVSHCDKRERLDCAWILVDRSMLDERSDKKKAGPGRARGLVGPGDRLLAI